uniref:Ovule protein n=1 Tax=Schistocephalus solidus TaxID=70667 RepID=A0A183SED6_SCHSO
LVVVLFLHRKLNIQNNGFPMFFQLQQRNPFDDDEGAIHPEFRSMLSDASKIGEPIGLSFTCYSIVPSTMNFNLRRNELNDLGVLRSDAKANANSNLNPNANTRPKPKPNTNLN